MFFPLPPPLPLLSTNRVQLWNHPIALDSPRAKMSSQADQWVAWMNPTQLL